MDRRTFLAALAVVVVIAMLAAMYLLVVSRAAEQGRRIQSLRRLLADQERHTSHLQVSIARDASVHNLYERAITLGLVSPSQDQLLFVRQSDR